MSVAIPLRPAKPRSDKWGPCYRCGHWNVPEGEDCFECKQRDYEEGNERPSGLPTPGPRVRVSALAERVA